MKKATTYSGVEVNLPLNIRLHNETLNISNNKVKTPPYIKFPR